MVNCLCGAAHLALEDFTFEDEWYQRIDQLDHRSRNAVPGTHGFLRMEKEQDDMITWRYRLFEVILALAKIRFFAEYHRD